MALGTKGILNKDTLIWSGSASRAGKPRRNSILVEFGTNNANAEAKDLQRETRRAPRVLRETVVVDADGQGLPHRRPCRRRRRLQLRLRPPLRLGHEALAELQEVLRGELRHLREALGLQEATHLLKDLVVARGRALHDRDLWGGARATADPIATWMPLPAERRGNGEVMAVGRLVGRTVGQACGRSDDGRSVRRSGKRSGGQVIGQSSGVGAVGGRAVGPGGRSVGPRVVGCWAGGRVFGRPVDRWGRHSGGRAVGSARPDRPPVKRSGGRSFGRPVRRSHGAGRRRLPHGCPHLRWVRIVGWGPS